MKYYILQTVETFACLAGKCPSSCCIGWKIIVDKEAYQRFERLDEAWLRDEVLKGIDEQNGQKYFKNQSNGKCIMLDEEHLCKIQKYTDEKTLCNTCRKYPRISNYIGDTGYVSLAASCPVVAHALLTGQIRWNVVEDGRKEVTDSLRVPLLEEVEKLQAEREEVALQYLQMQDNSLLLYQCFEKMAVLLLQSICDFYERDKMIQYFCIFEEERREMECQELVYSFRETCQKEWQKLCRNYFSYRLPGYYLEYPSQTAEDTFVQAYAELFLIRLLVFCYFVKTGRTGNEKEWEQMICLVYRLCVHGDKVSKKLHGIFQNFFTNRSLWCYMLL